LIILTSFASAGGVFTLQKVSVPTSILNNASTFNVVFNATYTGALPSITVDFANSTITQGIATISTLNEVTLNKDETKQIIAVVNFASGQVGPISGNIHAVPTSGTPEDLSFSIALTPPTPTEFNFCAYDNGVTGNSGDLKVRISDITVTGFGSDREWLPFDQIQVEVNVDNRGSDDVNNIALEWGLYNKKADSWVIDVSEEDNFDLSNGDDQTTTFKFKIDDKMDQDLTDLDNGNNYVLYVRATGEVDNTNSDETCTTTSDDIKIIIDRNFALLRNLVLPDQVSCGSDVEITGDVWNIGTKDQDEISIRIYNNDLKINQKVDIGSIDSFDKQKVDAIIKIPVGISEKSYTLNFEVDDADGNIYESNFDSQESTTSILLPVTCKVQQQPKAIVSADLVSGGQAGKELVVKATITNSGDAPATYLLNAAGYAQWATLSSISPTSLNIGAGKTGEALFTFNVNKGISGDQLFNIELVSNNELAANQPVSVTIEKSKTSLSQLFGDSWYIWLIGALNVILVVVIIIIAVKVSKKK